MQFFNELTWKIKMLTIVLLQAMNVPLHYIWSCGPLIPILCLGDLCFLSWFNRVSSIISFLLGSSKSVDLHWIQVCDSDSLHFVLYLSCHTFAKSGCKLGSCPSFASYIFVTFDISCKYFESTLSCTKWV